MSVDQFRVVGRNVSYPADRRCPVCRWGYISADQFLCRPCERKAAEREREAQP